MEFTLFGGVRVWGPDKEELHLGRKQCRALSLFMLSPGSVVSPDVLIDFLWAEKLPSNPLNSLQDLIKRLRLVLGDLDRTVIVTKGGGYSLEIDPDQLDAAVFRRLATAGLKLEKAEPMAARLMLERAMENSKGDLPDISPDFRASERVDELYALRATVAQALYRIDLVEEHGSEGSQETPEVWSLGGRPVGMALSIAELGELAIADLVGTVTRFGGRIHQLSKGILMAFFAEAGGPLRAANELVGGSHPAAPGLRGGAICHFGSPQDPNDVSQLLELLGNCTGGRLLVSGEIYGSLAAGRLKDGLISADDRHWQVAYRRAAVPASHQPLGLDQGQLIGLMEKLVAGSPRLHWGRTVQIARALEEIVAGGRSLRPE